DAPEPVDFVNAGVAFPGGDGVILAVFRCFDVNGVTRARCRAQGAADALFEVGVRMAERAVPSAQPCLDARSLLRVAERGGLTEPVFQRDAHAFCNADDTHRYSTPTGRSMTGGTGNESVLKNKCDHRPGEEGCQERDFKQPDPA